MTNHAPGPWAFTPHGTSEGDIATVYGTSQGWVSIHAPNWQNIGDKKVADANVRLIAAAPDLLKALMQIRDIELEMYGPDWEEIKKAHEIARAAIAKATGATE